MPEPLDPACLFEVLGRHGVSYVLIGGLAGVLHGSPVMTNDADIVPSRERTNLDVLAAALRDLEARLRSPDEAAGIEFDPHPELLDSMAMLNLTTRCGDLDVAFTPAGTEGYDDLVARSVGFDIDGLVVLVAALDDVIGSKEAANRPKDRATLPILYALREEVDHPGDGS